MENIEITPTLGQTILFRSSRSERYTGFSAYLPSFRIPSTGFRCLSASSSMCRDEAINGRYRPIVGYIYIAQSNSFAYVGQSSWIHLPQEPRLQRSAFH